MARQDRFFDPSHVFPSPLYRRHIFWPEGTTTPPRTIASTETSMFKSIICNAEAVTVTPKLNAAATEGSAYHTPHPVSKNYSPSATAQRAP